MTTRMFMLTALSICLTACGGSRTETEVAQESGKSTAEAPGVDAADGQTMVRHMHMHAEQLAKLHAALAAEDLEAAGTPAYWLSRHEQFPNLPDGWEPYLSEIRTQADVIDGAENLDTARRAADRLTQACHGCHRANGIDVVIPTG